MLTSSRMAILAGAAALSAAMLFAPLTGRGQTPADEKAKTKAANKAKQNAKNFENNAAIITFYDRQGKIVGTAGERALYENTVFSPDRARVAVIKDDQEAENADLWVLDIASGKYTRITTSAKDEFIGTALWSPDGTQLAYTTIRNGSEGVYRKASSGEGPEELLYKNASAFMDLSDWSADGRYLVFSNSDLSGGIVSVLPLSGQGERPAVEIFRGSSRIFGARFSPNGRFLAYMSNRVSEPGINPVFVRPFDPSGAAPSAGPWQIVENSRGRLQWGRDGKEFYYLGLDRSMMAIEVGTAAAFEFGKHRLFFRPPGAVPLFINDISRDGERFLVLPPPKGPQLQQLTIFDRSGQVTAKVGDPGQIGQPAFSPDGTRLVVMKNDLSAGRADIWTFEIATGKASRVTNDTLPKNSLHWSPDGKYIIYASFRGNFNAVYRRPADGSGSEELLFRHMPGVGFNLSDISPDGKFLALNSGGVILTVPLTGTDPTARKAVEFAREEFNVGNGRFSPDGRFLAYVSNEIDSERSEVFVKTFDPSTGMAGDGKWQLSKDGAAGMQTWRADGKEFLYRKLVEPGTDDFQMMAADVSTTPTFQAGTPKALFKTSGVFRGNLGNISSDGQRLVFAMDVPADAPAR
jgi:Tol biopolymer transport system component